MSAHRQWTREVEAQLADRDGGAGHTRVNCPACLTRAGKTDRTKSLSVNRSNGWIKCHRCGWRSRVSGDWLEFDVLELEPEDPEDVLVEQPSSYTPITASIRSLCPAVLQYLFDRRIAPHIVQEARLGFALQGAHAGRLIMPAVGSPDWRSVGWVGRTIVPTDKRRRYHQAEGMDTRSTFFNDDRLGDSSAEYHACVEGPIDALRHWPVCLGMWGKPKAPQLARLRVSGKPVVFVGDADAWREYLAAASTLRAWGVPSWCVRLPVKVDPALLPRKVFTDAVEYALTNKTDTDLT